MGRAGTHCHPLTRSLSPLSRSTQPSCKPRGGGGSRKAIGVRWLPLSTTPPWDLQRKAMHTRCYFQHRMETEEHASDSYLSVLAAKAAVYSAESTIHRTRIHWPGG